MKRTVVENEVTIRHFRVAISIKSLRGCATLHKINDKLFNLETLESLQTNVVSFNAKDISV